MRRLGAVLVVLLFVGVPALSALAATSVSLDLPVCCKKDGAHMCSVRRTHANQKDERPGLSALCPFALQSKPAVLGQRIGISLSMNSTAVQAPETQGIVHSQVSAPTGTLLPGNAERGPPLTLF